MSCSGAWQNQVEWLCATKSLCNMHEEDTLNAFDGNSLCMHILNLYLPLPSISMVPPWDVIFKHASFDQTIELCLIPKWDTWLQKDLLPLIHKLSHILSMPQKHQPWSTDTSCMTVQKRFYRWRAHMNPMTVADELHARFLAKLMLE